MATIPSMHTFTTGEVATAANINNNTVSAWVFLSAPPLFKGHQTVGQGLSVNTPAAILLDTEDIDTDNGHSTSSNTSRYTSQTAGWYEVAGTWQIGNTTGVRRGAYWFINGSQAESSQNFTAANTGGSSAGMANTNTYFLNVTDYIEMFAFSDVAATTDVSAGHKAYMTARWVHT